MCQLKEIYTIFARSKPLGILAQIALSPEIGFPCLIWPNYAIFIPVIWTKRNLNAHKGINNRKWISVLIPKTEDNPRKNWFKLGAKFCIIHGPAPNKTPTMIIPAEKIISGIQDLRSEDDGNIVLLITNIR